jgi:secondary thiamine-phosphate synthase enzyme
VKKEFSVQTSKRSELVDITNQIEKILASSKVKDGICVVYIPHTTAGVCINENADPSVRTDIENTLNALIPRQARYEHTEGNSDAHIKSSILGSSLSIPIDSGRLLLGTWQGIYLCEFDGPRNRRVVLKILGS